MKLSAQLRDAAVISKTPYPTKGRTNFGLFRVDSPNVYPADSIGSPVSILKVKFDFVGDETRLDFSHGRFTIPPQ